MKTRRSVGLALLAAAALAVGAVVAVPGPSPVGAQSPGTNIVCSAGARNGTVDAVTVNLAPTEGYISTPDGNTVYMWSYGVESSPGAGDAQFQTPAPTICVDEGDAVTVTLTAPANWPNIPSGTGADTPVSVVFPGQSVAAAGGTAGLLTQESSAGSTVTYDFTPSAGTFLYEGGTNSALHTSMGMYGGLVVYPTDGTAYGPGTEYDVNSEYLLLLHSIDPEEHLTMERWNVATPFSYAPTARQKTGFTGTLDPAGTIRHPRYWTINGRSMPDTIADNFSPLFPSQPYGSLVRVEAQDPANPGPPALVRYASASLDNHPFHPHGNHLKMIGQDGARLAVGDGLETFTTTVGSGQTFDLLVEWLNTTDFDAGLNPIPVTLPGLNNQVFKDDVTWYSGSPYLGTQAGLPPTTTSFNECGEFYFPWHSHALNEVQNFDEGFGGMLTLWRVDPEGGCQ